MVTIWNGVDQHLIRLKMLGCDDTRQRFGGMVAGRRNSVRELAEEVGLRVTGVDYLLVCNGSSRMNMALHVVTKTAIGLRP